MRVGIYIRVSTKKQVEDGISLESQKTILTEYAVKKNYIIIDYYVDEGISGKSTNNRDEFLRLTEDVKQKKIDIVLAWKISRIGRDLLDLLYFQKVLKENNVELYCYSENYNTNTAMGKLISSILGAIAQYELDEYSENIRMVFSAKAKRGGRMGHFVLGYDPLGKDSYSVNCKEKECVLKAFEIYNNVFNITKTANELNALGYETKKGNKFCAQSVRPILKRALYCGYIEHDGELYKGNFPAIISVDYFNLTQMNLRKYGKKSNDIYIIIDGKKQYLTAYVKKSTRNG